MDPIPSNTLLPPPAPELSPLEQDVLEEYERLAENMKKVIMLHPVPLVASFSGKWDGGLIDVSVF